MYGLEVKRWKQTYHANMNPMKAGVVLLILGKEDCRIRNIIRDRKGYIIILEGPIHQENMKS